MVTSQTVPSKARAVAMMVVLAVLGPGLVGVVIVAVPERELGQAAFVFAFCMVVVSMTWVLMGAYMYSKAVKYERAKAKYQRRREIAKAKYKAKDQTRPDEPSP
jgi:hypothetical protein